MDESGDLENSAFLLQRLQELRNWQKQLEEELLREQRFELNKLMQDCNLDHSPENDGNEDDEDDDTTIDQDLSSLHSEIIQSLPSWASRSSSSMNNVQDDPEDMPIMPSAKTFEQMLDEKLENHNPDPSPGMIPHVQLTFGHHKSVKVF